MEFYPREPPDFRGAVASGFRAGGGAGFDGRGAGFDPSMLIHTADRETIASLQQESRIARSMIPRRKRQPPFRSPVSPVLPVPSMLPWSGGRPQESHSWTPVTDDSWALLGREEEAEIGRPFPSTPIVDRMEKWIEWLGQGEEADYEDVGDFIPQCYCRRGLDRQPLPDPLIYGRFSGWPPYDSPRFDGEDRLHSIRAGHVADEGRVTCHQYLGYRPAGSTGGLMPASTIADSPAASRRSFDRYGYGYGYESGRGFSADFFDAYPDDWENHILNLPQNVSNYTYHTGGWEPRFADSYRRGRLLPPSNEDFMPFQAGGGGRGTAPRETERQMLDRAVTASLNTKQPVKTNPVPQTRLKSLNTSTLSAESARNRGECSICLDNFKQGDKATTLACSHSFHNSCISRWAHQQDSCPNCRRNIE